MHVGDSRLRTVIKVRHFQVKKAQKELAVITVDREQEEHHLSSLEDTKSSAMTEAVRTMESVPSLPSKAGVAAAVARSAVDTSGR